MRLRYLAAACALLALAAGQRAAAETLNKNLFALTLCGSELDNDAAAQEQERQFREEFQKRSLELQERFRKEKASGEWSSEIWEKMGLETVAKVKRLEQLENAATDARRRATQCLEFATLVADLSAAPPPAGDASSQQPPKSPPKSEVSQAEMDAFLAALKEALEDEQRKQKERAGQKQSDVDLFLKSLEASKANEAKKRQQQSKTATEAEKKAAAEAKRKAEEFLAGLGTGGKKAASPPGGGSGSGSGASSGAPPVPPRIRSGAGASGQKTASSGGSGAGMSHVFTVKRLTKKGELPWKKTASAPVPRRVNVGMAASPRPTTTFRGSNRGMGNATLVNRRPTSRLRWRGMGQ